MPTIELASRRPARFEKRLLGRASILIAAAVAACGSPAGVSTNDPTPAGSPASSAPASTPELTPEPSAAPSTEATTPPEATSPPIPSVTPEEADLLIQVTYYGHTGSGGDPGTTILADGRIIWADDSDQAVEAQLTPEAVRRVRDDIDATGALEVDARYGAKLRPGPEPPGHGVSSFRFEVVRGGRPVVVSSQDPRSFAGEEQFWTIPPEMRSLAKLARHLNDPVAGLGSEAFVSEPDPYEAARFLVTIGVSELPGDGNVPADDVRWPFGEPIELVGLPYEPEDNDWEARCLLIDSLMARLTVVAEQAVGTDRDLTALVSWVLYESGSGGSVSVSMTPLLPQESRTCVELGEARESSATKGNR